MQRFQAECGVANLSVEKVLPDALLSLLSKLLHAPRPLHPHKQTANCHTHPSLASDSICPAFAPSQTKQCRSFPLPGQQLEPCNGQFLSSVLVRCVTRPAPQAESRCTATIMQVHFATCCSDPSSREKVTRVNPCKHAGQHRGAGRRKKLEQFSSRFLNKRGNDRSASPEISSCICLLVCSWYHVCGSSPYRVKVQFRFAFADVLMTDSSRITSLSNPRPVNSA